MVAVTAIVFLIALRKPFWGLLATAFWYFFRPDMWGAEEWLRPVQLWTIATAVGWIISQDADKSFRHTLWMVVLLALMFFSSIGGAYADDGSWRVFSDAAKVFVFVFLLIRLCDTPRKLAMFVATMLLGLLWVSKAILFNWSANGFSGSYRADCPVVQGGGANFTALLYAGTVPFLVLGLFRKNNWHRLACALLLPVWLAVMVATGSRGGFLAMGVGLLVLLTASRKPWLVIATGVLGVSLFLAAPAEYWNRMETITASDRQRDDSAQGRLQNFEIALKMIADNPVTGVGLDKFTAASWRYLPAEYKFAGSPTVCHNTYLQLASEAGVVTSAAFVLISLTLLWRLRRRAPDDLPDRNNFEWVRLGAQAGLVATLVNAFFTDQAATDYFWWNYGIGFACLMVAYKASVQPATAPVPAAPPATVEPLKPVSV